MNTKRLSIELIPPPAIT